MGSVARGRLGGKNIRMHQLPPTGSYSRREFSDVVKQIHN